MSTGNLISNVEAMCMIKKVHLYVGLRLKIKIKSQGVRENKALNTQKEKCVHIKIK